ncbi:hypothetical protein FM106_00850 [Brachybacterium faecium]|nr:hypothetical protein FM106_00850 [Brachybacterium faecium]
MLHIFRLPTFFAYIVYSICFSDKLPLHLNLHFCHIVTIPEHQKKASN